MMVMSNDLLHSKVRITLVIPTNVDLIQSHDKILHVNFKNNNDKSHTLNAYYILYCFRNL